MKKWILIVSDTQPAGTRYRLDTGVVVLRSNFEPEAIAGQVYQDIQIAEEAKDLLSHAQRNALQGVLFPVEASA